MLSLIDNPRVGKSHFAEWKARRRSHPCVFKRSDPGLRYFYGFDAALNWIMMEVRGKKAEIPPFCFFSAEKVYILLHAK